MVVMGAVTVCGAVVRLTPILLFPNILPIILLCKGIIPA